MNWKGYLGIGLGTAVVVGGGLLLFNKLRNKKVEEVPFTPDPKKEETEKKTTGVSYTAEKFPLKIYMKGSKVATLQKVLGVDSDGYFGAKTESALNKKQGVKVCSEDLYNKLTNPTPTDTNGSNPPKTNTTSSTDISEKSKELARKLYFAMAGAGTNENKIKDVFKEIKTINDLYSLQNAYIYILKERNYAGKLKTLTDWLKDEMDDEDIDEYVNAPLKVNNVNYKF